MKYIEYAIFAAVVAIIFVYVGAEMLDGANDQWFSPCERFIP